MKIAKGILAEWDDELFYITRPNARLVGIRPMSQITWTAPEDVIAQDLTWEEAKVIRKLWRVANE